MYIRRELPDVRFSLSLFIDVRRTYNYLTRTQLFLARDVFLFLSVDAKALIHVTFSIIHLLFTLPPILAILWSPRGNLWTQPLALKSNVQYCSFHRLQLMLCILHPVTRALLFLPCSTINTGCILNISVRRGSIYGMYRGKFLYKLS